MHQPQATKKIVLIPGTGIGDSLLFVPSIYNLLQQGYQLKILSNSLPALLPSHPQITYLKTYHFASETLAYRSQIDSCFMSFVQVDAPGLSLAAGLPHRIVGRRRSEGLPQGLQIEHDISLALDLPRQPLKAMRAWLKLAWLKPNFYHPDSKQQAPQEQVPQEQVPQQQAPHKQVPQQQALHKQAPQEQALHEQVPQEQVPQQQALHEQVPRQQALHKQAPQEQVPQEQAPHEQVPQEQAPPASIPPEATPRESLSASSHSPQGKGTVAIHPSSSHFSKNWSIKGFLKVAQTLTDEGYRVVFCLHSDEKELIEQLGDDFEVWQHFSLPQLAARLAGCRLLIGTDSALGHLAALVGPPTLSIFQSKRHSQLWCPCWSEHRCILPWIPLPRFLRQHFWKRCISSSQVLRKAKVLLENSHARTSC